MNIYFNIEKLIVYAKIHLLLDEADEIYARHCIMQKLKLNDYEAYEVDEEEIEGLENPFGILDDLFAYAKDKGICKDEDRRLFNAELMDIVSLRPGAMEDTFESLSKNPAKALSWAFDYAVKNGSSVTDFRRWENKGDKNIEVVFADCCGANSSYPGCCFCDGEGFGVRKNERLLPLPIAGDWYYRAAKRAYGDGMGHVISFEHRSGEVDEDALNTMFDFVELVPNWFICTGEVEAVKEHAHFLCGSKLLPIHQASEKRKFKSKAYPYIAIAETNWYTSTLKLSCTNREKLVEFTLKLIDAYKQSKNGKVFVSLRKVESKFVVELSFVAGEIKKEHKGISDLDLCAFFGIFCIGGKVEERLKTIEKYLTKEVRFTPMCLVDGMENHAKMIDNLLKEVGTSQLGAVEAALDVKEECKKTLVASLNDVSAFNDEGMTSFLQGQDIQ